MASTPKQGLEDLTRFATECVLDAGQQALAYYGQSRRPVKFDEELVTQAELHLRDFFQTRLDGVFPDHHVFSIDALTEGYTHDAKRYLWIFDPIDGVDNFQSGIPIWGMSLALLENFWPVFGMFYMPATQDLFQAGADDRAYHGETPIGIPAQASVDDESLLLVYSRFHQHFQTRFPGKIRNLGCTAAHICYVAQGRADAAIIANESFQDLAATRVIVEAAGGRIFRLDGSAFPLGDYLEGERITERLVVAAPDSFEAVAASLVKLD
jgi:myo-inositol-1(or 4)-monophosphatase